MDAKETNEKLHKFLDHNLNYIIITAASFVLVFIFPFIGSKAGLKFNIPNTVSGWIVYVITKLTVSVTNVIIFHCFVLQGRENSKNHPNYIQACEMLLKNEIKEKIPLSPSKFLSKQYKSKGSSLFICTIIGVIGLSNMILNFNLADFISYLIAVVSALFWGLIEMKKVELYWQYEFLEYAIMECNKIQKEKKNDNI